MTIHARCFIAFFIVCFGPMDLKADADDVYGNRIIRVQPERLSPNPSMGSAHAPVTIEFFYRASHTGVLKIYGYLKALSARHPARLRIMFMPVGTGQLEHQMAFMAYAQNKYFEFVERLSGDPRRVEKISRTMNLERPPTKRFEGVLQRNEERRASLGVPSTALVINGELLLNTETRSLDALERAYDEHFFQAQRLMHRGVPHEKVVKVQSQHRDHWLISDSESETFFSPSPYTRARAKPRILTSSPSVTHALGQKVDSEQLRVHLFCQVSSSCFSKIRLYLRNRAIAMQKNVSFFVHLVIPKDAKSDSINFAFQFSEFLSCAHEQNKVWELASIMSRDSRSNNIESWLDHARRIGFDTRSIDSCLDEEIHADTLEYSTKEFVRLGGDQPPLMIVGDIAWDTYLDSRKLEQYIERDISPGLLDWGANILSVEH